VNREFVLLLISFLILAYVIFQPTGRPLLCATQVFRVQNLTTHLNYTSIQEAIDANETLNGQTIFVEEGVYYEHVLLDKSLSLIGANSSTTIVDANNTGTAISIVTNNVSVNDFTLENGNFHGILLNCTANCTVNGVTVTHSTAGMSVMNSNRNRVLNSRFSNGRFGIVLVNSSYNEVVGNHLTENVYAGIGTGGPKGSSNNLIANNTVTSTVYPPSTDTGFGLDIVGSANRILHNKMLSNSNGMILDMGYNNEISGNLIWNSTKFGIRLYRGSSNNTIEGNTIQGSGSAGLFVDDSVGPEPSQNLIYHNNFINPLTQAISGSLPSEAVWDNGVEGNYWSDYKGKDNNRDGIGDTTYKIYENGQDDHPLMGVFSAFNNSLGFPVCVVSNSTIEDLQYFQLNRTIRMHVSNATSSQTFGFCRVTIPHVLMNETYQITIDGAQPFYVNYTVYDDGKNRCLYFSYELSTREIIIVPQFPYASILLLLIALTVLAVLTRHVQTKRLRQP
jgi:parallel beta-helix repeat protein